MDPVIWTYVIDWRTLREFWISSDGRIAYTVGEI